MFKRISKRGKNRGSATQKNNEPGGAAHPSRYCGGSDGTSSAGRSSIRDADGAVSLPLSQCSPDCGNGSDLVIHSIMSGGSKSQKSGDRTVRFMHVQVREFERVIGDNPSCSSGAPIALGWAHGREKTMRLDDYESVRPQRRKQMELILNRQEREELLLEWGASFQQIIDSIRSNLRAKNQRRRTVNNSDRYDRWEEAMENAGRKIKRRLLLKKSSRQQAEKLSAQLGKSPPRPKPSTLPPNNSSGSPTHFIMPKLSGQNEQKADDKAPCQPIRDDTYSDYNCEQMAIITEPESDGDDNAEGEFGVVEEYDPEAPLPEINVVGKTGISEEFYAYMEEMTVNSGLTTNSGMSRGDFSRGPDGFEMLDRDNSFWQVAREGADFPRIRRKGEAVVVSEDGGTEALTHFDFWDSNGGYNNISSPPRLPQRHPIPYNSHSLLRTMD